MAYMTVLLALFLTGCAATKTEHAPYAVREVPPASLLLDCPAPSVQYETNGDLAKAILAWANALGACNLDKQALREWAEQAE